MTFTEFQKRYGTGEQCIEALARWRRPNGFTTEQRVNLHGPTEERGDARTFLTSRRAGAADA